jgi:hypothetical protein
MKCLEKINISNMYVYETSVGKNDSRQNVDELPVDNMFANEMFVDEMSRQNDCRQYVCI